MLDTRFWEKTCFSIATLANLQKSQKRLLRNVDAANAFHALLAFFLLLQLLALARNIAAITFRNNVLANGVHGFTGDDLGADGGLDRHLEHLAGNEFPHFGNQKFPAFVGEVTVHDDGERVHGFTGNQDVELHHWRFPIVGQMVIEGSVATRNGFEAVVKVEDDLVQGQFVVQHHARGTDVLKSFLLAAFFFDQLENSADVFFVGENRGQDNRLFDFRDFAGIEPARRIVDFDHLAIGLRDLVAHAGCGGDQVEIEFALQTFLDDLHVKQAQEAAAEAEAERDGTFRLEEKGRIVQAQFVQGLARGIRIVGDGVAYFRVGDILDVGDEEANFAGYKLIYLDRLGGEHAQSFRVEGCAVPPQSNSVALAQSPFKNASQHDDTAVSVEPGVENQRLE